MGTLWEPKNISTEGEVPANRSVLTQCLHTHQGIISAVGDVQFKKRIERVCDHYKSPNKCAPCECLKVEQRKIISIFIFRCFSVRK